MRVVAAEVVFQEGVDFFFQEEEGRKLFVHVAIAFIESLVASVALWVAILPPMQA